MKHKVEPGQRFGKLTVIRRADNKGKNATYLCRCACGEEKEIRKSSLVCGLSESCGCVNRATKFDLAKSVKLFWSKVKRGKADDCWPWIGWKDDDGYGTFCVNNVRTRAHRFSFQIHHCASISKAYVCHTCDNPSCVNPEHLFLGDAKINYDDSKKKGRNSF